MAGMMATQYLFPLVKLTEIICGLAILTGFFVPLALVVLAPVMLNIVLGLLTVYLAFSQTSTHLKLKLYSAINSHFSHLPILPG